MEISINTSIPKIQLSYESTRHKLGMRIWGDRKSFHALHEMLSDSWECEDMEMSSEESCSYIGIISYFSYEVRHAYMGDRLVTMDGKAVKEWNDEMLQQFEKEQDRFQVGMEFTWSHMLFIMASWWECLQHKECPSDMLNVMREFTKNIEQLLQKQSKRYFPKLEPYLHGAIYAANPYLMHTMEHVELYYLQEAKFWERPHTDELARIMECASYGTLDYNRYLAELDKQAKKLKCRIDELRVDVDDKLYNIELKDVNMFCRLLCLKTISVRSAS